MTENILSVRGLTRRFGGVVAVNDLDLDVASGEVLGVIGPNGAGKSTLVGLVCGALKPTAGTIALGGVDVTSKPAAHRARRGVGRTHQIPRPFARMTVLENLLLAADSARVGSSARERRDACDGILERTGLSADAGKQAGSLTLLRRKRLELARALALKPRLLMLDEIGAGLVESETAELIDLIVSLRGETESMLVIEHVIEVITACCDRTAVLDFGRLIALGATRDVLSDATVAAVYLGTSAVGEGTGSPASLAERAVESRQGGSAEGLDSAAGHGLAIASLVDVRAGDSREPLLQVTNLAVNYGGLRALRGIDISVAHGEVVTLLGANGAGKTTFAQAVAGALPLASGRIVLDGADITGARPDRVAAMGVAQCLEGRRIFATLSVEENLELGAGTASAAVRRQRLESVYSVFPVLAERRRHSGQAMSGGQQQMLAIARALMSAPRLLVFDEISLGLAPIAVDRLYDALAVIKESGIAMVLVEQNIERGLSIAQRAYVLSQGRVVLEGPAADVAADPRLASLYVGEAGTT